MLPSHLGIFVSRLLGPAPAGTALGATLLRAAPGRTPGPAGRLPLATLPGGRLSARGTSLRGHGSMRNTPTPDYTCKEISANGGQHTQATTR